MEGKRAISLDELFKDAEKFDLVDLHIEDLKDTSGVRPPTAAETAAFSQSEPGAFDFINAYVNYADVLEAPPEAHEAVATELIAITSGWAAMATSRHGLSVMYMSIHGRRKSWQ